METPILRAEKRDVKTRADAVRKGGKLPAVFYGRKASSTPIAVPKMDFLKVWQRAGESTVVTLKTEDGDLPVLIQDVAFDPVRGEPIHADFYVIEADRPVEVNVPLVFEGMAPAVKDLGGTLVKVLRELEIRGLPKDLPHEVAVNVSSLITLESQITARDIPLPRGITLITGAEEIVAAVAVAKEEEVAPPAEFDASQIEVEEKGKKEPEEGETPEETPKK